MRHGVLLAGGTGERFWPRSRIRRPKQFLTLNGKRSLIEESMRRIRGLSKNLFLVAPEAQRKAFQRHTPSLQKRVLYEPFARNTASAIALAVSEIEKKDPNGTVMVLPCDSWIDDERSCSRVLQQALQVAEASESIVTIGVPPTYPATGYGYLQYQPRPVRVGRDRAYRVRRFIEKPGLPQAVRLLHAKAVLWNIGIFVFRIPVLKEALKKHLPALYRGFFQKPIRGKSLRAFYRKLRPISFDRGILEQFKDIAVLRGNFGWSDLGTWNCFEKIHTAFQGKNVLVGDVCIVEGKNNIFVSEKGHLLAGVGISDLVMVHTEDATLVCPRARVEEVKKLVGRLKREKQFSRYLQ